MTARMKDSHRAREQLRVHIWTEQNYFRVFRRNKRSWIDRNMKKHDRKTNEEAQRKWLDATGT